MGGELLMPGWVGALSCLRLAGFPTDLGASDICKIFCADFHACVMTQEPFSLNKELAPSHTCICVS